MSFGDPGLDAQIARLHAGNPTIAQAAARLAMVRADARLGAAAGLPTLGLDTSAAHAAGPLVNAAGQSGNLFTARATASWELDLLGRLAAEKRAARHDVAEAEASLADVTLLMEAATARAWFAYRSAALAAAAARDASALAEDLVRIAAARQDLGLTGPDPLETLRERARLAVARSRELALARDSARRQLGYLTGQSDAGPVEAAPDFALPEPPEVPADLPADVLGRRPDLRAARARVAAADARLTAIRRGWLPPITLTAARGQASSTLGQLFSAAGGVFGLGALLAIPVFDGGRQRARVAHGKAERELDEATYRERVAAALRDVYDSLQTSQVRRAALAAARDDASAVAARADRTAARAANGTISRAQLIDARMQLLDRRISVDLAQGESLTSLVALQTALGGTW